MVQISHLSYVSELWCSNCLIISYLIGQEILFSNIKHKLMYTSPNKSLEFASLKRSLAGMSRTTRSGRVSKKRRRKRTKRSTLPKVVRIIVIKRKKKEQFIQKVIVSTTYFVTFMYFRSPYVHRGEEKERKEEKNEEHETLSSFAYSSFVLNMY